MSMSAPEVTKASLRGIASILVMVFAWLPSPSYETEIWIGGLAKWDNKPTPSIADGAHMFDQSADWREVAAKTAVIKLGPGNIEHASDDELRRVFTSIKERGLGLALADSVLVRSSACQSTTEAYGVPGALGRVLEKIKRNGGNLQYVAMDEPFYYGHRYSGPSACHEPTSQLAVEVAESVQIVRQYFPNAKIGDTEVVDTSRAWLDEIGEWIDEYKRATGEPLAFFHADVVWSTPAIKNLVSVSKLTRERGVPFGVIYNADETAQSNAAWADQTILHFTEIESDLGLSPDEAIFQTWGAYPTRMLPEDKYGSLTSVVLNYIRPRSKIELHRKDSTLTGKLQDANGAPISGAQVSLDAIDLHGRLGLSDAKISGVVPLAAATAVVGIRVNTEGSCACGREGEATIGVVHYTEDGTRVEQESAPDRTSSSLTLRTSSNVTAAPNLKRFSVTPGTTFVLSAPTSVTAGAENAGYVAIMFQDRNGHGVGRRTIVFSPSTFHLTDVTTDSAGRFSFQLSNSVHASDPKIRAFYSGGVSHRASMSSMGP